MAEGRIAVIGLHGGEWFGRAAGERLREADVIVGAARHLDALPTQLSAKRLAPAGGLDATLDFAAGQRARGRRVCLVASGDPGFFGIARRAAARLGAATLEVHPAPSSVSLAFARLGLHWDDAAVVSAHGRPLAHAVDIIMRHPKVAVLVSPDQPGEELGRALLDAGCGARRVAVCSRLGETGERVHETDLAGLAAGRFEPLAVVVFRVPGAREGEMAVAWGLPDDRYARRGGMITKAEVRAVALGKLALPAAGVLWDVGAGSGSVAVECARLLPALQVYAVERRPDDVERLRLNARGTQVVAVEGEAPAALASLPAPDRAFVGGGGLDVLDAVLARLRPGGVVVATYAALDRAAAAAARLGHLVQVSVSRGVSVGEAGAMRLEAENPVFVCWGPG